jgi:hypothetical protein
MVLSDRLGDALQVVFELGLGEQGLVFGQSSAMGDVESDDPKTAEGVYVDQRVDQRVERRSPPVRLRKPTWGPNPESVLDAGQGREGEGCSQWVDHSQWVTMFQRARIPDELAAVTATRRTPRDKREAVRSIFHGSGYRPAVPSVNGTQSTEPS